MMVNEFRGKCIKTGEWVYGGFHKHQNRTPCPIGDKVKDKDFDYVIIKSGFSDWNMPKPIECFKVIPETVGQHIGIKDVCQRKVFQGDIVKVREVIYTDCSRKEVQEIREYIGEVVWHQYCWQIARKTEDGIAYRSLWLWNVGSPKGEEDDTMEVLGNRWDNPELLDIEGVE